MSRSPAPLGPTLRVLLPALTLVLLGVLTLWDNSATRLYVWPWYLWGQLLWVLPLVYMLLCALGDRKIPSLGRWLDGGLLLFAFGSVASALLSTYRGQSVSLAAPYVYLVALTYGISAWLRDPEQKPAEQLKKFSVATGLLLATVLCISYAQWFTQDVLPIWSRSSQLPAAPIDRNGFPFGHSTYTAGFAVLAFPWLTCLAWQSRGLTQKLWAFAALLTVALLATTGSRGGIAGFIVTLLGLTVLVWTKAKLSQGQRFLLLFGAVVGGLLLVLHEPRLRNVLLHQRWDPIAAESNTQRRGMAEAGMLMGRAHPWLGFGPGTVPLVYPKFRSQLSGGVENVLQVHNTYLELWAEMGAAGVLSILLLGIGGLRRVSHLFFGLKSPVSTPDAFRSAAALGLLSYAVMASTDHQIDLPIIGFLLAGFLAVLALDQENPPVTPLPSRTAFRLLKSTALVGLVILFTAFAWPNAKARWRFASALDAFAAHDQVAFMENSRLAVRSAAWDTAYVNEMAALLIEEKIANPNPAASAALVEQIKRCFQFSLQHEPEQEYVHFNLGWLALDAADPAAVGHFAQAARIVPDKGGVYLGMSLALLAQERPHDSAMCLAIESLNDPSFLASPWWQAPEIAALKPEVSGKLRDLYTEITRASAGNNLLLEKINYAAALSAWLLGGAKGADVARTTNDRFRADYFRDHPTPLEILAAPSVTYRRERTGFPVLTRHADFPPPRDLYVVRDNTLALGKLSGLFPAKGWLPTSLLAKTAETSLSFLPHGAPAK